MLRTDLRSSLLLKHANVVDVVDLCSTPERAYYFVTEYIEGCTLRAFVDRRGRVTIEHAIHVVIECCKALAHAHSLDVTHRDIRPSNLMLSTKGEVKVTDFGLAKANTQRDRGGQFSYLSPEAAKSGCRSPRRHLRGRHSSLGAARRPPLVCRRDRLPDPGARPRRALRADRRHRSDAGCDRVHGPRSGRRRALVRDVREVTDEPSIDPQALARVQADVGRMISIVTDDDDGTPSRSN